MNIFKLQILDKFPRTKNLVIFLLNLSVSTGIIIYIVSRVDANSIFLHFRHANPLILTAVLSIFAVQILLSTYRWSQLLRPTGRGPSYLRMLMIWMEGSFFNQTLPSVVGGDAFRTMRLRQAGLATSQALLSVALDRLFALVALLLVCVSVMPAIFIVADDRTAVWALMTLVSAGITGLTLVFFLRRLPVPIWRHEALAKISDLLANVLTTLSSGKTALKIIGVSILIHGLSVLEIYSIGRALDISASPWHYLILIPPVLLVQVLPISLNGWGVREGAMVTAFGWANLAASEALAISITYGFFVLLAGLPGGIIRLHPKFHSTK